MSWNSARNDRHTSRKLRSFRTCAVDATPSPGCVHRLRETVSKIDTDMLLPLSSGSSWLRLAQPAYLCRSSGLGSTNTNAIIGDDDERASELIEHVSDQEAAKYVERGDGALVREAEPHDAVVGSRLVDTDIAEADVERHEHPFIGAAGFDDNRVGGAREALIDDGVDFVATLRNERLGRGCDVLVELDLHEPAGRP
jgi:hypothetical protein